MKSIRRELGKVLVKDFLTCRKMAAILGQVRACLPALPCLRAFSDHLVAFVNQQMKKGWDAPQMVPQQLKDQITDLKDILKHWPGCPFPQISRQKLHSDSSDHGWAGLDLSTGKFVQEFWRQEASLHINVKELKAAVATVQSLAKPNSNVLLSVDNQVTFHYLRKGGGKIPSYNAILRPFLRWCVNHRVNLSIQWVPSALMLADQLSRWTYDQGDYTLHPPLFQWLCKSFKDWITPEVDCFASPGNCQLQKFIARWTHHQAWRVNALTCSLQGVTQVYDNPPWTLLQPWLCRLREERHLKCLLICPYWASARWWPLLTKLHVPKSPSYLILPFQGMFQNCWGHPMEATRWPLLCTLLSGSCWRNRKCRLKVSTITWKK